MMASYSKGHWVILCDLCKQKEVQLQCISCENKLCKECVGSHAMIEPTHVHKIVKYEETCTHFSHPFCQTHSERHCAIFCRDCDIPICTECQNIDHKNHVREELPKVYLSKRKEIIEDTRVLEESLIPKYTQEEMVTKSKHVSLSCSYTAMEKKAESYKREWQEEVNNIFARFAKEFHILKEEDLKPLHCHQDQIKMGLQKMHQTMTQNREILKKGKVSQIINYISGLEEFQDLALLDLEQSPPTFLYNSVQETVGQLQLEELSALLVPATYLPLMNLSPVFSKILLDKVIVIATVRTTYHAIRDLACVGLNKVWVNAIGDYEDSALSCYDICGEKLETVTVGSFCNGLTMDTDGRLLYSEFNNIMSFEKGEVYVALEMPSGWEAKGIFCSKSENMIVCVTNEEKDQKVLLYKNRVISKEIQFDENGEKLYTNGEYMLYPQENINGDVCVVDHNSNSVVVSSENKLRFRYGGKGDRLQKDLNTNAIVTDQMGHIIVADEANDCLHIIDQNGQFLKCLEIPGLTNPTGLSLDTRGRLWVGSKTNGNIKVTQYMKYTK